MVSDFALPHDDYGQEIKNLFPEWRDAIIQADGLVIVSPEYNHGYPGALKAVLDLLLQRIHNTRSVAFVGVSAGPWGGTRVIEAMVTNGPRVGLIGYLHGSPLSLHTEKRFDDEGKLLDPAHEQRARGFLDELVWMSRVAEMGPRKRASKYHTHLQNRER